MVLRACWICLASHVLNFHIGTNGRQMESTVLPSGTGREKEVEALGAEASAPLPANRAFQWLILRVQCRFYRFLWGNPTHWGSFLLPLMARVGSTANGILQPQLSCEAVTTHLLRSIFRTQSPKTRKHQHARWSTCPLAAASSFFCSLDSMNI